MADDANQQTPEWKVREIIGARAKAADIRAADRDAVNQVLSLNEAERDRTAAREDHAHKNARYCAGHDWVQEFQERTGQTRRR